MIRMNYEGFFREAREKLVLEITNDPDWKIQIRVIEAPEHAEKMILGWAKDMDCSIRR